MGSATGEVGFGLSGGEETPPESVVEEVRRRSEERYDLSAMSPGTVLGFVDYDDETGEVIDLRWEEPATRSSSGE